MGKINMRGKWAVVTGASSGIGLEFARHLASLGTNLLMVSNQPEALDKCAQDIADLYKVKTQTLDIDLSADDAIDKVMHQIRALPHTPIMLINNAGIFDFREVSKLSDRRIDLYIDLHMRAVTHLCRQVGALMAEQHQGYILNMSSMSCWMPMPGIAMYSATKAYMRVFSRAYRIEMLKKGVSVTVACPGGIATDLFGLPKNLQKVGVGVGALARPEKFARKAVNHTLRRKAQYINGLINRISIVAVALLPEWGRLIIKSKLLDRLSHD